MELLSQLTISRPEGEASIQLLHGDLTALPPELAVDILAVSAFRADYSPLPGTLLGALSEAGLSVAELAEDKDVDLMAKLGCWLSRPLTQAQQERFNVKKILCFEPTGGVDTAETEVSNLFRGLNAFALDERHNGIAMPVLATADQQFPLDVMMPILLDTAIFWFENGLPLTSLKLVLHRTDQVTIGLPIFENVRKQYELKQLAEAGQISAGAALNEFTELNDRNALPKMAYALQELTDAEAAATKRENAPNTRDLDVEAAPPAPVKPYTYDYFISYSHKNTEAVQELVAALQARDPSIRIFYDRNSIPTGGLWIKLISDAIQQSKNVVCVLSPAYSQSAVCWDEFQCAYVMEKRKRLSIKTINFQNDEDLPPMMAIYSYIDCTEGDINKLKAASGQL